MPIRIVDSPEPLSDVTMLGSGPDSEPLLVSSAASRVLQQELKRYCLGMINGRSFLIAGHRGAGKTTLVAKSFLDVRRSLDSGEPMLRPIFVPLHGPSLFPAAGSNGGEESGGGHASDEATAKTEAQIALEQITLGLHRAVSREFAERYRQRAADLAYLRRTPNQSLAQLRSQRESVSGPRTSDDPARAADAEFDDVLPTPAALQRLIEAIPPEDELFEIAGAFETELYEGPSPQRLREFWDRLQAMSGGVLFAGGYARRHQGYPAPPTPVGTFPNLAAVHAQGTREIVALYGVLEAYRRISGDYTLTEGGKSSVEESSERTTGFDDGLKEIVAPVVSLLTAGLAATGLAISGAEPILTAAGAIAVALGSAMVFKVSSTRKRDRSLSREYEFVYDLSVATLDRVLPILIERLRGAGIAPVFVVDELDKVGQLSSRIVTMVHHLKKLVAENAFFCFLTNRSYFEEMVAESGGRAYPVEYTYYTHRLFVVFSPEDFERYLRRRIPDPATSSMAGPEVKVAGADEEQTKVAAACAILRWALRHRSQLHVVDLQREIAALRDDQGSVRTPPEVLASSRRNRIDTTFQVGIELTLAQRDAEQVVMDRPEFRRLLHDAMFYISRKWLQGEEEVDLSESGLDDFRDYLEVRTGRDEERTPELLGNGTGGPGRPSVSPKDLDFLFDQVGFLADYLSDRPSVETPVGGTWRDWREERIAAWNEQRQRRELPEVETDVLEGLLIGDRSSLLVLDPSRPNVFRFRHPLAGSVSEAAPFGLEDMPELEVATPGPEGEEAAGEVLSGPEQAPSPGDASPAPGPVTAPAPDQGVAAATPARPGSSPPRPASSPSRPPSAPPEWERQALFIEEFARAVEDLAVIEGPRVKGGSNSAPALTLDTLATRFRVLPATPTASVVLAAIANLRDATRRKARQSGHEDDVFQVDEYYRLLIRNGKQIANAVVLGAIVGRTSPDSGRGNRIVQGLGVISRAMRFATKREEDIGHGLENVAAMVRAEDGQAFERPLQALDSVWPDVAAFRESVEASLNEVTGIPVHDPAVLMERSWDSNFSRLARWVETGEALDADLSEMEAAAARIGPSEVLEFDPREMTLQQWTRALVWSYHPASDAPWLSVFAWHAMGFRAGNLNEAQKLAFDRLGIQLGANGDETNRYMRITRSMAQEGSLLGGAAPPPRATLVMLRRTNSPLTAGWRPGTDRAVLLLTADELGALTFLPDNAARGVAQSNVLSNVVPPRPGREHKPMLELPRTLDGVCAIEMEPEFGIKLYNSQLAAINTMLLGGGWIIRVYPTDRGPEMKGPNVVAPGDPAAVVDAALRHGVPVNS